MRQIFEDHLFSQGYLVAQADAELTPAEDRHPAEALLALARFAEIRITAHPELADLHMLEVAARNLGKDVPEPFYRGFPQSVLELTPNQLLFDQLVHYFLTYGIGDFSAPGHSILERLIDRVTFAEDVDPKPFAIVTSAEAEELLDRTEKGFLASTRPLSDANYELLEQLLRDRGLPQGPCACKDTACRLILSLRDPGLAGLIALPDIPRLLEWMLETSYPEMRTNKLNLKNKDRKLLTALLDRLFERGGCDIKTCVEKRRVWRGLLHHLHYRPKCDDARALCDAVRGNTVRSAYSEFEALIAQGKPAEAAQALRASKGQAAVLRLLVYLLSRCESQREADAVLETVTSASNKIVLIQLIQYIYTLDVVRPRTFVFVRLGLLRKHAEDEQECFRRKSFLSNETILHTMVVLNDALSRACHGTLGKVFADKELSRIALPLREASSQGGYGTLPCGSRMPVPRGKKLRAFVYWEKVDDIDLSCFAMSEEGSVEEYSWRTMSGKQTSALTFSGDMVSGYNGASEYYDVNLGLFAGLNPNIRYLVFCANVFTQGGTFDACTCRAGFMLRDENDSGQVYEPKTVKSSFAVNCASAAAYLFALDLAKREFVWLNTAEHSARRVAGTGDVTFLMGSMRLTEAVNLYDFARMLATEVVDAPEDADVIFSDAELELAEGQEQVRSCDSARVMELLNA